jgi:IS4 transposase
LGLEDGFFRFFPAQQKSVSVFNKPFEFLTFLDLAASIETSNPGYGPSRQAVHLRMDTPLETFIHRLPEDLITGRIFGGHLGDSNSSANCQHFTNYKRVLVQDSTIIKMPMHLFAEFSGVSNGHSKVCNARVQATYELMGWTILITTISPNRADFERLLAIYGLRWRIEVIFKAWKSHMKFDRLHRVSRNQMLILLKARLLLITCGTNP